MSRQYGWPIVEALPTFTGTRGRDRIRGTGEGDSFDMSQGGHDKVSGLAGNDGFYFGSRFDARDMVNGGSGDDSIALRGRYDDPVVLQADRLESVERLSLIGPGTYRVALTDLSGVDTFGVGGDTNAPRQAVEIDGSGVTDMKLGLFAGSGDDVLIGGAKDDTLGSGRGDDLLDGGGGNDKLYFYSPFYVQHSVVFFGGDGNDNLGTGQTAARSFLSGDAGNDTMSSDYISADTFYFEADSGDDRVSGFTGGSDKLWINVAGVDSFDDLTLAPAGAATVISWGDDSSITVSLYQSGLPYLTAKDFEFGTCDRIEDARARLAAVRAFGDADAPAAHDHAFAATPHYAALHEAGGVLA